MPKHAKFIQSIQTNSHHEAKAMRRLVLATTTDNLWLYVLSLLVERDYFAYELRGAVKEHYGVEMASVTAYVLLYKLQRDGLVDLSTERREGKRPTRKYYRITEIGRRSLADAKKYLQLLIQTLAAPSA
ncbi:MAG: PadR family transcriptional regulator [Candidatus Hermodarchaeota archaeon]|jgi:PadR family transcriptional regulator PadR|nr:PadR family transcriptional regulator [Candidatus Hermodarchaeota archaeon]